MSTYKKPDHIPAKVIMEFHRSTGLAVMDAARVLREASPILYERLIIATEKKDANADQYGIGLLYDPIEDYEELKECFDYAENAASAEVAHLDPEELGRRYSRIKCDIKKRILREKFGLEWFSTYEMNPLSYWP